MLGSPGIESRYQSPNNLAWESLMTRLKKSLFKSTTIAILFSTAIALAMPVMVVQANSNSGESDGQQSDLDSKPRHAGPGDDSNRVSPAQRIRRDKKKPENNRDAAWPLDGSGNHRRHPDTNAAGTQLRRYLASDYYDAYSEMAGQARPGPREISNTVFAQDKDRVNSFGATDFVWQWGQFLDHDIDLTGGVDPAQDEAAILVPVGDPYFDPDGDGDQAMAFNRSLYSIDDDGIRQQLNEITGWIDASNVYGSDDVRHAALRRLDGSGKLKTGVNNLLPDNDVGLANAGGDTSTLFLAGDVRANEQAALTAMHTLFMREHNRWAELLRAENPQASGDEIFEHARALVAAEMQHITYTEFLPVLLGPDALPPYRGYRQRTDARIMNVFSTAAYRLGHSMLSPVLLRLDENLRPIDSGHLQLRDAFFAPEEIRQFGIEPLLRGLSKQLCQEVDSYVIDEVRNFLFGEPGRGGFDLTSLNIQRGRDHGLPSYNEARRGLGLSPAATFEDISSDPGVSVRLAQAYDSVEDVDLWVGGIAEDKVGAGMLGEVFHAIVRKQFEVLRDGDRRWYTRSLKKRDLKRVTALSLADIIRLNTDIGDEIQDDVFRIKAKQIKSSPRGKNGRQADD
ncbi:MAG: peroxiredoxin [Gammaproteobacteria bacterium]|nr:peroxiredoxin [Gammaproteobacteria bacterium]